MASFTGVGDNVTLRTADRDEAVSVALSGTYNMTIALQREKGSPGSGAFEEVKRWSEANATVAHTYYTESYNESLRLIVLVDTSGTCTATLTDASDLGFGYLDVKDRLGNKVLAFTQTMAVFYGGIIRSDGAHFQVNSGVSGTDLAGKTVRINNITNIGTANDFIGVQVKPAQGASTAKNVIGCEISARVNSTFALTGSGTLIGAHIDAYLKGTAGDVGGDVRGAQIELVTDDAGTRTITGNVVGLRFRAAFSGTISGKMIAIRVEKAEAQTNSKQWDYVLDLPDVNGLIWDDDFGTEPTTAAGGFKVRINGSDRWVQTFSGAPVS